MTSPLVVLTAVLAMLLLCAPAQADGDNEIAKARAVAEAVLELF